ncbi:hypothetical protein [Myroides sp. WP-1]|uniref:hypothetical protein n=1 Tax=Myroides sp. WP-1 TaxID=2759944 RepID=UPI0015F7F96E|nr:hypothetical protein [Myroides sp. WP-1]MBB1139962.1 hypothetical protein [Myroides sp. WP-1]
MEFQTLFTESKGQPIHYKGKELRLIEKLFLNENEITIDVEFISTNSKWVQGIVIETKGDFKVNNQILPFKIVLWEDTAPKKVSIEIFSKDKKVNVYNVWRTTDGTVDYWHNGAAFYIEKIEDSFVYYCNDGCPDDDFDDLIFKVKVHQ